MTKRTRNFWIEVALLSLVIVAVSVALLISELSPLNKEDVKLEVGDLRSYAAAAGQLVNQHLAGQTTDIFFVSQTSLLKDKAKSSGKTLRDAKVEPVVEKECREAADLAEQVTTELDELSGPGADLTAKEESLKNLGKAFRNLESRLK